MSVISMGPGGILGGRLGQVQFLTSFEVSVTMEEWTSASFAFACPSWSVRLVIVLDMFATVVRSDWVAVARFARAWLWSCVISANIAAFAKFWVFEWPYPMCCDYLDWSRCYLNAREKCTLKFTQVFAHYPFCSIHDSTLCKILCSLSSFLRWWQFVCRCMGFVAPRPLVHPWSVAQRFRIMFLRWWGFSFDCWCHRCLGSWVFRTCYLDVRAEYDMLFLHTPCTFSWV